jgi:hypothetical protein
MRNLQQARFAFCDSFWSACASLRHFGNRGAIESDAGTHRTPKALRAKILLLSFHQSRCLLIERGEIRFARLQIKFVDQDLHQRRGRDGEKNSQ